MEKTLVCQIFSDTNRLILIYENYLQISVSFWNYCDLSRSDSFFSNSLTFGTQAHIGAI